MSKSDVTLKMSCRNRVAQLFVVDGDFRVVARGTSPLVTELTPGIYSLKAKVGDAVSERVEVLRERDDPYEFELKAPEFESAVPISGTSTHHEYQELTPGRFTGDSVPNIKRGDGSAFVLYVRDSLGRNFNAGQDYAANFDGFRLQSADGKVLVNFDADAVKDIQAGYIGAQVRLDAGSYVLAREHDGECLCLPVQTVPGLALQIYLRLQPVSQSSVEMRPDFRGVSYVFDAIDAVFDPSREDVEALETVRFALEKGRNVVQAPDMRALLSGKFRDPMLGLYAAHILLMDEQRDVELLDMVICNTAELLRPDFPDVVALAFGYERLTKKRPNGFGERPWADLLKEIKGPPLLVRSWDLLVACAKVAAAGEFGQLRVFRVASDLAVAGIYLVWQTKVPRHFDGYTETIELKEPASWYEFPGTLIAQSELLTNGYDWARNTAGRLAGRLPQTLQVAIGQFKVAAAEIRTPQAAALALQGLAGKYRWDDVVQRLRRADSRLAQLTGLQRDLMMVLRQAAADSDVRRGLNTDFVTALLNSNRVPIDSLAEALAGLDETAAAAFTVDRRHRRAPGAEGPTISRSM
jgi:hypothetical protein